MSRFKASASAPPPPPVRPAPVAPPRLTSGAQGPGGPRIPRVATGSNPFQNLGFFFTAAFVTVQFGYIGELLAIVGHVYVPLVYVFGGPAVFFAIVGNRWRSVFRTRVGYYFVALNVLFLASVPFSVYRSASLSTLKIVVLAVYPVFLLIAGLVTTVAQVRVLMYLMVLASILDALLTLKFGVENSGRLSFVAGSLGNSNDFALHLLIALPLCLFFIFDPARHAATRLLMATAALGMLYLALQSGSRAGVVCLIVICLFGLWKASAVLRIILAIALLLVIAALPTLAPETWTRLAGKSSSSSLRESREALSADESAQARLDLLRRSIQLTVMHPLFGVGIGEFSDAESGLAASENVAAHWQVTHNAYTQVSSECGIPALICFCGVVFGSLRLCLRLHGLSRPRAKLGEVGRMALAISVSVVCLVFAMLFDSIAYLNYVPTFAGLSVALWNASQDDLRAAGV